MALSSDLAGWRLGCGHGDGIGRVPLGGDHDDTRCGGFQVCGSGRVMGINVLDEHLRIQARECRGYIAAGTLIMLVRGQTLKGEKT